MTLTIEQIEKHALALGAEQRVQLTNKLLESLEETSYPSLSQEWEIEIEHRRQKLLEGTIKTVSGEEVSRKAWELAQGKKT